MRFENLMVIAGEKDTTNDEPLFWSNDQGWVDLASAAVYTEDEVKSEAFTLPISGEWVNAARAFYTVTEWWESQSYFAD